eukprot:6767690-Prymnesium_polylepis.1
MGPLSVWGRSPPISRRSRRAVPRFGRVSGRNCGVLAGGVPVFHPMGPCVMLGGAPADLL